MATSLGTYLRDRRAKLDPAAFGFSAKRRRTPGLRREEVAQRANVSPTWYTWLEQGRGGAPSADVLDRIARALMLTHVEREHLFLLALGRPPEVRFQGTDAVTPRLQRVLDALELSPAIVKTSTWDIVAWNDAALAVLGDYQAIAPDQRNILRFFFSESVRTKIMDWDRTARYIVGAFRADVARSGATERGQALVDALRRSSAEFDAIWQENDVQGSYGEHVKSIRHPVAGLISLDYSAFAVDGRPDLSLVIYTPATPADAERVRTSIMARRRDNS